MKTLEQQIIEKLCEIAIHVGLPDSKPILSNVIKGLQKAKCVKCDTLASELSLLSEQTPDKEIDINTPFFGNTGVKIPMIDKSELAMYPKISGKKVETESNLDKMRNSLIPDADKNEVRETLRQRETESVKTAEDFMLSEDQLIFLKREIDKIRKEGGELKYVPYLGMIETFIKTQIIPQFKSHGIPEVTKAEKIKSACSILACQYDLSVDEVKAALISFICGKRSYKLTK